MYLYFTLQSKVEHFANRIPIPNGLLSDRSHFTRFLPRVALVGRHETPSAATISGTATAATARVHDAVLVRVERRGVVCEATAILERNLSISLKKKFLNLFFTSNFTDESSKTARPNPNKHRQGARLHRTIW